MRALQWIKETIVSVAYFILYFPFYIIALPYLMPHILFAVSEGLDSLIAKRASDKIFHTYYKIFTWIAPDARAVRQYQFGSAWLDYLNEKTQNKPRYRCENDFESGYNFIPREMSRHCWRSGTSPIDLVSMQVIVRGLSNNTIINKLKFFPGLITYVAMQALAKFLEKNKSIEEICVMGDYDFVRNNDREDNFSLEDSSIESLTKSLINNQKLRKLNLSYLMLSKTSWLQVIRLLENNHSIRELILSGNTIDKEIATKLTQALLEKQNIEILDLTRCDIDDEGVEIISNLIGPKSNIKTLKLTKNMIRETGLQAIAEKLNLPNKLITIDLSNNEQNCISGVKAIFNLLSKNSTIENVYLNNMGIGGIMPLAAASLLKNKTIRLMDLSYNYSSNQYDIKPLASALTINSSLKKLNLKATGIGNIALTILSESFKALSIEWLDLSNNNLTSSEGETSMSIQSLHTALGENTSLRYLALPEGNVNEINNIFINDGLIRNKTLSTLNLGNNYIIDPKPLAIFLASSNSYIKHIHMSNCNIDFFRQLLPNLASIPQTIKLNRLSLGVREEDIKECIKMVKPIIAYRKQELRSFYLFLAKNNNNELRNNTKQTLQWLPEDVCRKISEYIPSRFEIN